MPKRSSKLGYLCPVCNLDYGSDKLIFQKSTRKRGQTQHALSGRRIEEDRIHLTKLVSKPVEYALGNHILELYDKIWLDKAADQFLGSLKDGTWKTLPIENQESIFNKIAEVKARADLRVKHQKDEEMKYGEWDITLTENDTPYFELATRLSKPYGNGYISGGRRLPIVFNPAKEILRYRREGDGLRHLDVSGDRQTRVLAKYHSFRQKIIDEGWFAVIQRGSQLFNQYREPFSNALWTYTWVEWFWIVLYAHKVSAREATRMLKTMEPVLAGQSIGKISSKQIKNRMEPVIVFWQDFYEYVPRYLEYLNEVELLTRNDLVLYKIDRTESAEHARVEKEAIHRLINSNGVRNSWQMNGPTDQEFNIHEVTKVGKEMILVRHPNQHYKEEMDEFRSGQRKIKPQRKTSCCFDPWPQKPEVLAALIRKGIIDVRRLAFDFNPPTDDEGSFRQ